MPSPEATGRSPVPLAQLRAVGTAFLRTRPWIVAPAMIAAVVLLALSPAPRAQVVALSLGMSTLLAFFTWEAARARRAPFHERHLFRSLLVTQAGIGFACVATGALRSPIVPLLFAPTVVGFAAFGRARTSTILAGCFAAAIALLAAVPRGRPFPPIASPWDAALAAIAIAATIALLRVGVSGLTDAYGRAATALDVAREAVLVGAEARSRALESIGAKVAHEIKNPLSSVRGLVELVAEGAEGRTRTRLDVVLSEVARIEGILRDYLSYARPLSELRPTAIDLRAVADEVRSVVEARAEHAGVAVAVQGASIAIEADPARLKEALLNLVGNALEATSRGGLVVLELAAEQEGASLRVRDTGRGMSRETVERLGAVGFTTREGGTGLGFVLARAAIAQHGGSVHVESEPGSGTVVTLRLPARPPSP